MLRHGLERGALHAAAARSTLDGLLHGSVLDRLPSVLPGERAWLIDQHRSLVIANWDLAQRGRLAPTIVEQCEAMRAIAALRPSPPRDYLSRIDEIAARGGPAAAALPYAARKLLRCDGATRLARVALAAAEYRATHGDFPASLDELRPMFGDGVALDPYTDAPFVYERTAAGVRIASAGRLADEATVDEATLRDRCLVWELKR
jgi:hypothetical protein